MADTRTPYGLSYHPYAALLGYMEEPLTVRLDRPASEKTRENISVQIARTCSDYRKRVNGHVRRRALANGSTVAEADDERLAPHLFSPAQWLSFGRTDAVSVTLLDDFSPFFTLLAHDRFPVVQGCLGFCPKMDLDSLGLRPFVAPDTPKAWFGVEGAWPFDPPHAWFDAAPDDSAPSAVVTHSIQQRSPLLVVSRFKVGGMTALAGGVAYQWAVFRTLAKQVVEELDRLHRAASASSESKEFSAVTDLEINADDVKAVRCLVLDGQGAEDIVLLVACTNYSVGIQLITRLRTMTLGEVFETDDTLLARLTEGEPGEAKEEEETRYTGGANDGLHARALWWVEMQRRLNEPGTPKRPIPKVKDGWASNHVFSDSFSNLSTAENAFLSPNEHTVRGCVRVVAQIDATPGHMLDVEDSLKSAYQAYQAAGGKLRPLTTHPHRFLVGRHDYLEVVGEDPASPLPVLSTRDYFRYVAQFARPQANVKLKSKGSETGFMNFASSVLVPFPDLNQIKSFDPTAHVSVLGLLEAIHTDLFHKAAGARRGKSKYEKARLTISRLRSVARKLRMPASLKGAVERLFQAFAAHLADPYVFDSVIDLYDVFASIYTLITDDLPQYQLENNASPFGQWLTHHLDDLIEAVRNALDHRVRLMLPNADMRDRAVDLRGGLSKLVAAADVPLKCGLYLVNRSLQRGDTDDGAELHGLPVARVAGVTRFSFNPQTTCSRLTFPPTRLFATLRMDVMHVTRPLHLLEHIHEAAHLFYSADRFGHPAESEHRSDLNETAAEVFAETLTHLLVFVKDSPLFLRRYVADYGVHTLGTGPGHKFGDTTEEAQARFFLFLLRGFLTTLPIRELGTTDGWPKVAPATALGVFDNPLRHTEDFLAMVEEFGPFHAPFREWWAAEGVRLQWKRAYMEDVTAHAKVAKAAWEGAYMRYRNLYQPKSDQREELAAIYKSLLAGRPVPRPPATPGRDRALDTVEFVCRVLYAHTRLTFRHLDPTQFEVHLYRRPATGSVSFAGPPGRTRRWGRFQLDGAYSGLFCADPRARAARMLQQIAIHKTFWDISAHLRLERLNLILSGLWPLEPATESSVGE